MADQKDTASVAESKSPEQQRAAFFQSIMLAKPNAVSAAALAALIYSWEIDIERMEFFNSVCGLVPTEHRPEFMSICKGYAK